MAGPPPESPFSSPFSFDPAAAGSPPVPPSAGPPTGAASAGLPVVGRRSLLAGLICAAAMAVAGFPLGLLWAAVAPHIDLANALAGNESAFAVQSDVDARFGLICVVAGVIGGAAAFWRVRDAGWPVPLGLAAGGFGGALIAGWIGHLRRSSAALHGLPKDASPVLVDLVDVRVRAHGLYLVMPVAALVVLAVALWVTSWPAARGRSRGDRRPRLLGAEPPGPGPAGAGPGTAAGAGPAARGPAMGRPGVGGPGIGIAGDSDGAGETAGEPPGRDVP
ncbi:conserved membrane hypothetical protein [Frankia canadensis]|uniref:DUF2567 domain-containing protein n=1 Tax=Frankia canadensis TaxID=1836972 RepID=A0A2I2KPH8_9ACTN|nr:conserved membrane hypothetical protein [Frankia canadensis]SOU54861.1 conserved membrane hypothetical protein [Frankia canadensis]